MKIIKKHINFIIFMLFLIALAILINIYDKDINKWFNKHKPKEYENIYIDNHKYIKYYNAEGKVLLHSEECTNPKHIIK